MDHSIKLPKSLPVYARCLQRDGLYNFYRMDARRRPVGVEVICFLNSKPHIRYDEYRTDVPGDLVEIDAIINYYERISKADYLAAYKQATESEFDIYLPEKK